MSELSELYTAMVLKTFGLSLIGIFVPIYLYQKGFSITQVIWFMILSYSVRTVASRPLSRLVYRRGPKSIMRYGLALTVGFLLMLLSLGEIKWPPGLMAAVDGIAIVLFYTGYHIDFSRAKILNEFGREAERVFTLAKLAAASAPFIGGLAATLIAPEAAVAMALVAVALAGWPLSRGAASDRPDEEPTDSAWKFKKYRRSYLSLAAIGLDQTASVVFWPFFAALFIFSGEIYLELGLVTSVSAIGAILMVHAMGKLIDDHRGGLLLTYSAWMLSVLHFFRALAGNIWQVLGINIVGEWSFAGVHMPYLKGMYDEADAANDRVAYIGAMETAVNVGRLVFWLIAALCLAIAGSDETGFRASFVVAALLTPLILRHNFAVLKAESENG